MCRYVSLVKKYSLEEQGSCGDTVKKNLAYVTFGDDFLIEEIVVAGKVKKEGIVRR
jgi:hypothetical protein